MEMAMAITMVVEISLGWLEMAMAMAITQDQVLSDGWLEISLKLFGQILIPLPIVGR